MSDPCLRPLPVTLKPDPSRTVIRPFYPVDPPGFEISASPRARRIIDRVLALDDAAVTAAIDRVLGPIRRRHRHADEALFRRYEEIGSICHVPPTSRNQGLLIGAYFSEEYSFEAAALFNPSIVLHPDQSELAPDTIRFILSLRGIGEGHVSSVTFRIGTWQADGALTVEPPKGRGVPPRIAAPSRRPRDSIKLTFDCHLSAMVLFPVLPSQEKGIEDLRLVRFVADDGSTAYLGTYTAFDGQFVRQELLEANADFSAFTLRSLSGSHMDSKGMALFPRKIAGRHVAVGR